MRSASDVSIPALAILVAVPSCGAEPSAPAPGPPPVSASPPPQRIDVPQEDDAHECTAGAELTAPGPGLELIADSIRGFSGTQGQCGWSYGYIAPATSPAFQPMTEYHPVSGDWYVESGQYWTVIDGTHTHPKGTLTSRGRRPVEHWTVRRWTSSVDRPIRITGEVRKAAGAVDGNGVLARIVVDRVTIFEQQVVDETGTSFDLSADVKVGAAVDFVVDPNASDDAYDSTFFEARVWR
jgi:hypothetical protein